jgi:hypothetical protein
VNPAQTSAVIVLAKVGKGRITHVFLLELRSVKIVEFLMPVLVRNRHSFFIHENNLIFLWLCCV